MGKRVDQDATQEVSASQLVRTPKPPVYPKVPTGNDASMWMQTPVSADDFLSGPTKKPSAPRSGRGVMVALLVMLFVGTAGVGVWYSFLRDRPKETSPLASPAGGSAAPAKPAVATESADAGVAVAAPDAAVVAAVAVDAGMSPEAAALNADAVSGADPAVKKSTKKRATTKKTVKKKTATAPKKKRR
jgi:hypothetical protein